MSLYQKHRPSKFEDMVGNENTVKALSSAIKKPNRPHVYLLVGRSGCGKTTAARICAQELGASEMAITEINSANNRGIETARQISEQMRYAPVDGDVSVFIIDEVHQCTRDWMNAMLKYLEDTPDHVYFFLCTTDPQKLIKPLVNRCTDFRFDPLKAEELMRLLRKVQKAEGWKISPDVLETIAETADGSPRKALVILEKVAGMESLDEQMAVAKGGISEGDEADTIELCRALLSEKTGWGEIATLIKNITVDDPEKIRYAVIRYMSAVLLSGRKNDRAAVVLEYFSEPFYNTGKPGLVLACYQSIFAG